MEFKQHSTFHPLAVIPEEEQSTCSEYSAPSDCECFKFSPQVSEESSICQKNDIKEKIQRKGSPPFVAIGNKGSSTKRPIHEKCDDNIFSWRLKSTREKLEATLLNIFLSINNIAEPDGIQDLRRRQQRDIEFTARFCRNYLYQFRRQILVLQHRLKEKAYCGLQQVFKTSISQKLLNAHHLAHLALQAVLNHISTTLLVNLPNKLKEFLILVLDLSEITTKSGIVRESTDNIGEEIEKCCRDILSILPDAGDKEYNTHFSAFSENANRNYELMSLRKREQFSETNRFSMYITNVSAKRRDIFLRSSQNTKKSKSAAQGKESVQSSKSDVNSYTGNHIPASNENSSSRTKVLTNAIRNKRDEAQELAGKSSEKKHKQTHVSFNMDNIETMIESISSDKNEEDDNRCQQFSRHSSSTQKISSQIVKESDDLNPAKKKNHDLSVQSSKNVHNMKLMADTKFEEPVKISEESIKLQIHTKESIHSKYVDCTGINILQNRFCLEEICKLNDKQKQSIKNTTEVLVTNNCDKTSKPPQNSRSSTFNSATHPQIEEPVRDNREGMGNNKYTKKTVSSKALDITGSNVLSETGKVEEDKDGQKIQVKNCFQVPVANLHYEKPTLSKYRSSRSTHNSNQTALPLFEEPVKDGIKAEAHSKSNEYLNYHESNLNSDIQVVQKQLKDENICHIRNTCQLSVKNSFDKTGLQTTDRSNMTARNVKLIILPPFEESGRSTGEEFEAETNTITTVNCKYGDCVGSNPVTDLQPPDEKYKIKNETAYPTENISKSLVVNSYDDKYLPPQDRFEDLYLENVITFRDQGNSSLKETNINYMCDTKDLKKAHDSIHVECGKTNGPLWLKETIAIEKNEYTHSHKKSAAHVGAVSDSQKGLKEDEKDCTLSDDQKTNDTGVSSLPRKLKINTSEVETALEYKKKYHQYLSSNPMYMNSAKPWLIVSSLADTLITEVLHDILDKFDLDTLITQMLHMELQ